MPLIRPPPSLAVARICNHGPLSRSLLNGRLGPVSQNRAVKIGSRFRYSSYSSFTASTPASQHSPTNPETPRPPRTTRILISLGLYFACFAVGFTMAAAPTLTTASEIYSPITDSQTMTLFTPEPASRTAEIEEQLLAHPLVTKLLADSTYHPSRPHLKIPPSLRPHNLTGGTLQGPDLIAVPPLSFTTRDGASYVSIQYLGGGLCGHPGLVHGGLLATLLDEGLARCCFPALPNKVGVTASLKVDYRKPCQAEQFVVLRAETTKVEGRKAWVKGRLETLVDESKGEVPVVLVEAEALFVEPKGAATMKRIYPTQEG